MCPLSVRSDTDQSSRFRLHSLTYLSERHKKGVSIRNAPQAVERTTPRRDAQQQATKSRPTLPRPAHNHRDPPTTGGRKPIKGVFRRVVPPLKPTNETHWGGLISFGPDRLGSAGEMECIWVWVWGGWPPQTLTRAESRTRDERRGLY
jgi:hypothetical protein